MFVLYYRLLSLLGTQVSMDDGDGNENVTFKMNWHFFQTLSRLFQFAEISLELISWGPLSSL